MNNRSNKMSPDHTYIKGFITEDNITLEALEKGIKNTKLPIPFYDSDNPKTRKQIGEVIEMYLVNTEIHYNIKLNSEHDKRLER